MEDPISNSAEHISINRYNYLCYKSVYQMGISKYTNSIPTDLAILGLKDDSLFNENDPVWKWEHFKAGTNYHAFLLYTN